MSEFAKDRPLNAQETAVFWVEYVIRHNGAPHMHYPGADLNFFQFNSLDVISFLLVVLYIFFKVLKLIVGKLCCGTAKVETKKGKRKTN